MARVVSNTSTCSAHRCRGTLSTGRRPFLLVPLTFLSLQSRPAYASMPTNRETPNSDPFIQSLLQKSEEQREERAKARLQDYYRRNFADYFNFEGGAASSRGISKETAEQIEAWLRDNR